MKIKNKQLLVLPLVAGGLILTSGRVVADLVVSVPVPSVSVNVDVDAVPDTYCWDGDEYVGIVGDQYNYLGPGNVWLVCDPVRLTRFNDFERVHPDWRTHLVTNERYRNDAHGHAHPLAQQRREDQINDTQQRREDQINDTQQRREDQINDTQQRRENQINDTQQRRENQINDAQQKKADKSQDSGH